jgi:molybdopterin converting factor small subunit
LTETTTIPILTHKIKLIGVLATAAGKREVEIQARPNLTLSEIINLLLREVTNLQFKDFLIDSATQNPRPNVIILLDEQDCNLFDGLKTRLESETKITIIPVAHGG